MKSMREMIKLMEGVMAVPGVGSPGGTESDMQTAGTVGRDQAYSQFDAAQPAVDEAREPMYHSVFYLDPDTGRWAHQFDADDFMDADDEKYSLTNQGVKAIILKVPKSQADWSNVDVDAFVKNELAGKVNEKAPPGEEALVKDLKKEYPGHEEKAFATAWSIYNRKHGQANEEVEEAQVDSCNQNNPKAARYACAMEEDFDLNNGYDTEKYADGDDYFPNGADSPVVKATGPSGARQGDNPEQKKMQIAELHKELVYGYRKYLKESKK